MGTHRRFGVVSDASPPAPSTTLLSAQEAKQRLREIVEGFFFRRLTAVTAQTAIFVPRHQFAEGIKRM